jgi:hypothetical protein
MKDNEEDLFGGWTKPKPPETWELEEGMFDFNEKLDIWDELREADMGNRDFYASLKPTLQKQFSPLVAMRWFSSTQDGSQYRDYILQMTNEMLNIDFFTIAKHPELQWKILALCGVGKSIRRQWIAMPKRRRALSKVDEFMLQFYPSANDIELEILTKDLTREEFEQFAKSSGCTDIKLKEVIEAFELERGLRPEKAKATSKKRKA